MATTLTPQDFAAFAAISAARRDNLRTLFTGARIQYGALSVAKVGATVAMTGNAMRGAISEIGAAARPAVLSPGRIRAAAEALIQKCADVDNIGELVEVVGSDLVEQLIKEVMPVVGVLMSARGTAVAWAGVISSGNHLYNMPEYKTGVLRGDPLAAADAVHELTKRALARHTVDAARNTAVLGAKIAGLFADLGTATTVTIGLANALAGLALELAQLGADIKELRAGNLALAHPESLTLEVFTVCPLLGCYLLTSSDTSNVANFFIADIGTPGWMDRLEVMKRTRLDPLLELSGEYIRQSKLRVTRQDGAVIAVGAAPRPTSLPKQVKLAEHGVLSVAGVKERMEGLSRANLKFQFNRLVRAKLPF